MRNIRGKITDLAHELCEDLEKHIEGATLDITESGCVKKYITRITSEKGAKQLGRPQGTYSSVEVKKLGADNQAQVTKALGEILASYIKDVKKILVVGLGNNSFIADSLGPKVCDGLIAGQNLCTFAPNVIGATGIPSTEAVRAIVGVAKPSHVIVVDSLCCHERERLGNNFQVSDTGITPGSGVARNNKTLNEEFLGVPVIALGVPLVIYLPTLHYVVPKAIDMLVLSCVDVIVGAIRHTERRK